MSKRETMLVPDGFNGHTVLVYADPIQRDGNLVNLQVAEPGKEYMHTWKPESAVAPTHLIEAMRLLRIYTSGRYDAWLLSGSSKASVRAHIMSVFYGYRVPQSKSGVTVIRHALQSAAGITGETISEREDNFMTWIKEHSQEWN